MKYYFPFRDMLTVYKAIIWKAYAAIGTPHFRWDICGQQDGKGPLNVRSFEEWVRELAGDIPD